MVCELISLFINNWLHRKYCGTIDPCSSIAKRGQSRNDPRTTDRYAALIDICKKAINADAKCIGGSGFIAAHVLDILLERGHSVVTTVRSKSKAQAIRDAHPKVPKEKLDLAIVEDIAVEGAFDEAVKSNPEFEAVIHTASPFHFNATDVKSKRRFQASFEPL